MQLLSPIENRYKISAIVLANHPKTYSIGKISISLLTLIKTNINRGLEMNSSLERPKYQIYVLGSLMIMAPGADSIALLTINEDRLVSCAKAN